MEIQAVWENLHQAVKALEARQGDWEVMAATCLAALEMFLEFPPDQVLEVVEASELPTRAFISWLVYEGDKLGGASCAQAAFLALSWEAAHQGQRLIAPPPAVPVRAPVLA